MGDKTPTATAAPASTRRRNLARTLTLVHREGAQTRAELTRRTALNRSTVGDLVAELAALGLVREAQPVEAAGVGRPSPVVSADPGVAVLTANPDIDAVTVGLVGLGGTVHKRVRYPTTASLTASEAVDLIAALVEGMRPELDTSYTVIGIGLAVPGLVERSTGTVRLAPHLGWRDEPLADRLAAATGYRCVVANDARTAMVAEGWFGAGRGLEDFVYLNGSASGIGGGIVSGGRPIDGRHGYAGEFGHTVVNPGGVACHCGRTGCLETEVRRERLLQVLGLDDSSADQLSSALTQGRSVRATAEIDRQLGWLTQGLSDVVGVVDPEAVILGGFLASLSDAAPGRLQESVKGTGFAAVDRDVDIVPAALGADVLTIGAAELLFDDLLNDPQRHLPRARLGA